LGVAGVAIAVAGHATAARGDALFGMSDVGQYGGPDELVRIDRATGVATRLHTFGIGFNLLESLCFDARESVLWSTNDGTLLRIDPQTFNTITIGDTGVEDVDGLAIQPSTGTLFGITYGGNDLVRIDKTDGGTTVVNGELETGSRLEDLAFDSTGRLYVLTSTHLVEVSPTTGLRISRVLLSGATSLEGLVWDALNATFLSAADRGAYKDLVTINRATGAVAFVSMTLNSGFKDIEALAFVPGSPGVPVAMQALDATRDDLGAALAWQSSQDDVVYLVDRAPSDAGPWSPVGRVTDPVAGRAGAWRFEYRDVQAATPELAAQTLYYRVGAEDAEGAWTFVHFALEAAPPSAVALRPNRPNPFNPTTTFEFRLAGAARVELEVYDVQGHVVRRLGGAYGAGTHQVVWDGRDARGRSVAAGVYPYKLRGGDRVLRGSAVLVK
jgi:hypothetical protein